MKHAIRLAIVGCWIQFVSACGGSEGSNSEATNPSIAPDPSIAPTPAPLQTSNIQAMASFDFRVDSTITINLGNVPPGKGVVNIYYKTAFYDQNFDKYYPDYLSLVASWRPSVDNPHRIIFNKNWGGLLFEWVPESAELKEQTYYFEREVLGANVYLYL